MLTSIRRCAIRNNAFITLVVLIGALCLICIQLTSVSRNVNTITIPHTLSPADVEKLKPDSIVHFEKHGSLAEMNDITPETIAGGMWPNGRLFIDMKWKNNDKLLNSVVDAPADVQLLMGSVGDKYLPLKERLISSGPDIWNYDHQTDNAFLGGRDDNMNQFKPGVKDIKFVFSDINARYTYWFPWFEKFREELQPLIDMAIGTGMNAHIGRMQMAKIENGAKINKHIDSGNWPTKLHRIHIPILVPPETVFEIFNKDGDIMRIPIVEGSVFELNNRVAHQVNNYSPDPRVHLIIDVAEEPFTNIRYMKVGQTCAYKGDIICDER